MHVFHLCSGIYIALLKKFALHHRGFLKKYASGAQIYLHFLKISFKKKWQLLKFCKWYQNRQELLKLVLVRKYMHQRVRIFFKKGKYCAELTKIKK
jgi:hypothetical protein